MLSIENVYFSYSPDPQEDADWILRGISLSIPEGGFLGIAGPTGSGKSTLAQVAAGLIRPTRGQVRVEGAGTEGKPGPRTRVGLAFQYPERQLFGATVLEDVAFGPGNLGANPQEAAERARAALLQVGLDPDAIADTNPFRLSGGQQRKVALAGVLAMDPAVLVLDEPAAGLDPAAHSDLIGLVRTLNERDGLTVAMVSHSMEDLAVCCDRIAVLSQGAVAMQGSPSQVFGDPEAVEAAGLCLPQALAFAREMKKAGLPLPSDNRLFDERSLADAIASLFRG